MITACVVAWALLTACGEYLLHEASMLDGWRSRVTQRSVWWAKMLSCYACPWGWSSVPAGLLVMGSVVLYTVQPWAVVPVIVVLLPALGLGLARVVGFLSPMATCARRDGG